MTAGNEWLDDESEHELKSKMLPSLSSASSAFGGELSSIDLVQSKAAQFLKINLEVQSNVASLSINGRKK